MRFTQFSSPHLAQPENPTAAHSLHTSATETSGNPLICELSWCVTAGHFAVVICGLHQSVRDGMSMNNFCFVVLGSKEGLCGTWAVRSFGALAQLPYGHHILDVRVDLQRSVTFMKISTQSNIRIYSYNKIYTNKCPNICAKKCMNIWIYSNICLMFTL